MAALKLCALSFFLSLLLLCHSSQAQLRLGERRSGRQEQRRCRVERLSALEPLRRTESEAGYTEYFDENNEQLECAGVAVLRQTIEPRGLLLPSYSNAPRLVYILQGRGLTSAVVPGCPETFQSSPRSEGSSEEERRSQRPREQHQKVHRFRQGDIIALPAGVSHWCYNDGDTPVVAVHVFDTSNSANQLDRTRRHFLLAGSRQGRRGGFEQERPLEREGGSAGRNILSGFDVEMLADAIGVSRETARRLQSQDDRRGHIVRVEGELRVLRPPMIDEREEREEREGREQREQRRTNETINGLDEAFCTMRIRENIDNPRRADVYNPRSGRINTLNSQKLPILRHIQMSAERGVLHRNAILAPRWNINAHSVAYVTRGRARCQVVDNRGRNVFDGELRRDQLLVVPQHFAVVTRAGNEGFSWVSFKTSSNAMTSPIVGKNSVLRGMPEDVLANAYQISREEARRLKFNRGQEATIFSPRSQERESDNVVRE